MSIVQQLSSLLGQNAGQVYTAVGTAVAFSAGLAVAYAGLGLQNPSTSKVKITPLKIGFAPTGTGGTSNAGCPYGFAKLIAGTAALGTLSAFTVGGGVVTGPGLVGTATGAAVVFGTATVLNGTAGPSANGLCIVTVIGVTAGAGTGAGTQAFTPAAGSVTSGELHGEVTLMPGESGVIFVNQAIAGIPSITWLEQPLQ